MWGSEYAVCSNLIVLYSLGCLLYILQLLKIQAQIEVFGKMSKYSFRGSDGHVGSS